MDWRTSTVTGRLFATASERKLIEGYRKFFSIAEIEVDATLQLAIGALLLSLFLGFSRWFYSSAITQTAYLSNDYICWPYFQDCGRWYFLKMLPEGYTQGIFYMAIFGVLVAIAYLMYRRDWTLVHVLLLLVLVVKVLIMYVLTQILAANFDYYDTLILFVLLILPYKFFFARLTFVMFYFLSSTIKIHEGWILGTYFTALQTGLPIFGNALAPMFTNLVIFMQIVGSWFLFSRKWFLQRAALTYFIIFHLYSGVLVGYRFPTAALLLLLVLFGLRVSDRERAVPISGRAAAGWFFVLFLTAVQFVPILFIKGDQKMTLEGDYYGFFMFEANHQCISSATFFYKDGTKNTVTKQSYDASQRCDPYEYWFALRNQCERNPAITRVAWTFDHSINGGPFYRIVDEENACALTYAPFAHNDWIRLPEDGATVIGYPVKNYFQ